MQFWHHSLLFSLLFYSFQHANKNSVRNSGNSEVTAKVTSRRDCNLNYPGKGIWKWSRAGASDVQERKEAAERKKKGSFNIKNPSDTGCNQGGSTEQDQQPGPCLPPALLQPARFPQQRLGTSPAPCRRQVLSGAACLLWKMLRAAPRNWVFQPAW